jgi:hypothetical protein
VGRNIAQKELLHCASGKTLAIQLSPTVVKVLDRATNDESGGDYSD